MSLDLSRQFSVETDENVIKAELDRVLGLRRFSGAPQMSAFLKYVVSETLAGHADRIKAYSVGVDALGKPDTFDAQSDPSVRVLALRLRKSLSEIYENVQGCMVIIDLRVGTYVPAFYKAGAPTGSNSTSISDGSVAGILMASATESQTNACVTGLSSRASASSQNSAFNQILPSAIPPDGENSVLGTE